MITQLLMKILIIIIAKGEEAKRELDAKIKKFTEDTIKFKMDETAELYDFDDDKYYVDKKNGLRFESESVALRYLEAGEVPNEDVVSKVIWIVQEPKPSTDVARIDEDTQVVVDKDNQANNDSLDWLPGDWEVDNVVGENEIESGTILNPRVGSDSTQRKMSFAILNTKKLKLQLIGR